MGEETRKARALLDGSKCPKCGSTLLSNGKRLWCSFVGGVIHDGVVKSCDYGVYEKVEVQPTTQAKGD